MKRKQDNSVKNNTLAASRKAAELLYSSGCLTPPIDPEFIARTKGIDVIYAAFKQDLKKEISGFLSFDPLQIIVNKSINPCFMTFTIAHELAHYLLHERYARSPHYQIMTTFQQNAPFYQKTREEQEADLFAVELLIPKSMLKKYKNYTNLEELSRIFAVPKRVIFNRMKSLGFHDIS